MDKNLEHQPLVSIIMTTYNRADLIGAAITSVLAQTYQNWELLILDDASTDDTKAVVTPYHTNDPRIHYLPAAQNLGITPNRNRGLEVAAGQYIAVLDSDDLWIDTAKLARQVAFLENHPDHVLVGTMVRVIDREGAPTGTFRYGTTNAEIRRRILGRNQFTHSAIMWRRSGAAAGVRYSPDVAIWEDYELILHLGGLGKLANLGETMTAYRRHEGNISKSAKKKGVRTHLDIIKKYRRDYPHYLPALLKGYARFFV